MTGTVKKAALLPLLYAVLILSGCAMLRGKIFIDGPDGNNPPLLYATAMMEKGRGQVTAVTIRKVDGRREKVELRWTGGFDLFRNYNVFYREMIEPGQYMIYSLHADTGGKTYINAVPENLYVFDVRPEGIQYMGEILVSRDGNSFSFRMSGLKPDRKSIIAVVEDHMRYSNWAPLLEEYRKNID